MEVPFGRDGRLQAQLSSAHIHPRGSLFLSAARASSSSSQTLPHELPLGETHPELVRRRAPALVQPAQQAPHQLLPHLTQVASQRLGILSIPRTLVGLVQREARLARQTEVLEREVDQALLGGLGVLRRFYSRQAVGEEEDAVDQVAVGGALDLEVAEEDVGAEEREGFVEDVVRLRLRVDFERVRASWERGESVGWAAGFGAQGQQREVAWAEDDGLAVPY